jgi:hypothetical protein
VVGLDSLQVVPRAADREFLLHSFQSKLRFHLSNPIAAVRNLCGVLYCRWVVVSNGALKRAAAALVVIEWAVAVVLVGRAETDRIRLLSLPEIHLLGVYMAAVRQEDRNRGTSLSSYGSLADWECKGEIDPGSMEASLALEMRADGP